MQFTSLAFAIFLFFVFLLYWKVKHKYRMPLLLLASLAFYMSFSPAYVLLLLALSVLTYVCAKMAKEHKGAFVIGIVVDRKSVV